MRPISPERVNRSSPTLLVEVSSFQNDRRAVRAGDHHSACDCRNRIFVCLESAHAIHIVAPCSANIGEGLLRDQALSLHETDGYSERNSFVGQARLGRRCAYDHHQLPIVGLPTRTSVEILAGRQRLSLWKVNDRTCAGAIEIPVCVCHDRAIFARGGHPKARGFSDGRDRLPPALPSKSPLLRAARR